MFTESPECAVPGIDVQLIGIDQGTVNIEDESEHDDKGELRKSITVHVLELNRLSVMKCAEAQPEDLFRLAPDYVLVVPAVDECVDLALGVVTEEDPAFDAFAEKEIGCFGEQLFLFAFALDE